MRFERHRTLEFSQSRWDSRRRPRAGLGRVPNEAGDFPSAVLATKHHYVFLAELNGRSLTFWSHASIDESSRKSPIAGHLCFVGIKTDFEAKAAEGWLVEAANARLSYERGAIGRKEDRIIGVVTEYRVGVASVVGGA